MTIYPGGRQATAGIFLIEDLIMSGYTTRFDRDYYEKLRRLSTMKQYDCYGGIDGKSYYKFGEKKDKLVNELAMSRDEVNIFEDFVASFRNIENGALHSFDSPACIIFETRPNTMSLKWFFRGRPIEKIDSVFAETDYYAWINDSDIDINHITPEDEQLIMMKWA